jgi:hypothetical protein
VYWFAEYRYWDDLKWCVGEYGSETEARDKANKLFANPRVQSVRIVEVQRRVEATKEKRQENRCLT